MKKFITLLCTVLLMAGLCACEHIDSPDFEEVADFEIAGLTLDNFPFIDCSTSTSPLRDILMYEMLDIPWRWGLDIVSGPNYKVWFLLPDGMIQGSAEHIAFADRIHALWKSSGSHGAYVNLIDGTCRVIIDSRDISRNEADYAAQ